MEDISQISCNKWDMVQNSGWHSFPTYESFLQYFNQTVLSHLEFHSNVLFLLLCFCFFLYFFQTTTMLVREEFFTLNPQKKKISIQEFELNLLGCCFLYLKICKKCASLNLQCIQALDQFF